MRVGVIGTGFGARVVAPVFADTEGCEVVDVVSPRDDAAVAALCARADVDLVSVHSPPFLHAPHAHRAIEHGKAVLCDKPFALDVAEGEALLAAAEAAGVVHLCNFEFRQHPVRRALRRLVHDGAIGEPEHFQSIYLGRVFRSRPWGWLFQRRLGGGWSGAWGSHEVDKVRWLLGEVVAAGGEPRTTVTVRRDAEGAEHTCDADDGFTAWMRLASGATAAIDTSACAAATLPGHTIVAGSEGVVEMRGDDALVVRRKGGVREEIPIETAPEADPHLEPMRIWARMVRDAVRTGEVPPEAPTFADGVAADRVLDAFRTPLPPR